MTQIEIERKFLITKPPENLAGYPFHHLEQAYLSTEPVIRVRKQEDSYELTCKGGGMMTREEFTLALTQEAYLRLKEKADGNVITKTRYLIPLSSGHTVELDLFQPPFAPLMMAEVEFTSQEDAKHFMPPDWFGEEVTYDKSYHNSAMSKKQFL